MGGKEGHDIVDYANAMSRIAGDHGWLLEAPEQMAFKVRAAIAHLHGCINEANAEKSDLRRTLGEVWREIDGEFPDADKPIDKIASRVLEEIRRLQAVERDSIAAMDKQMAHERQRWRDMGRIINSDVAWSELGGLELVRKVVDEVRALREALKAATTPTKDPRDAAWSRITAALGLEGGAVPSAVASKVEFAVSHAEAVTVALTHAEGVRDAALTTLRHVIGGGQ